jgi:hypothetical protein
MTRIEPGSGAHLPIRDLFCFALHAHAIDQVKQEQRYQREEQDEEEGADIPEIGHHYITNFG